MAHTRYVMDARGLNRYARESPELKRLILARAERGASIARALAPVNTTSRGSPPFAFRDSIHVVEHPVRDFYGSIFGARIVADSKNAVWAEFGRTVKNPYEGSHALKRAANYLNAPKRSI